MRAIIYARVSHPNQDRKDKISIKNQVAKCKKAIADHGWVLVHDPFIDRGISGQKILARKDLQAMLKFIRNGKADLVVTYENDRMGRLAHQLNTLNQELDVHNCQLYSLSQPIEPKPPEQFDPLDDDTLLMTRAVAGVSAELEVRKLMRRQKMGLTNRVKRGNIYTNPPYGYVYRYQRDGTKSLAIDSVRASTIKRIFKEYVTEGKSMSAIAIGLNTDGIASPRKKYWKSSVIFKILTNPTYCGKSYMGARKMVPRKDSENKRRIMVPMKDWIIADGNHRAIVAETTWNKVQSIRSKKHHYGKRYGTSHLLSGLVKCGLCGYAMYARGSATHKGRNPDHNYYYFACSHHVHTKLCEPNTYRMVKLEEDVINTLSHLSRHPEQISELQKTQAKDVSQDVKAMLKVVESELKLLATRLYRSRVAYEEGVDSLEEYVIHRNTLLETQEAVSLKESKLKEDLNQIQQAKDAKKTFQSLLSSVSQSLTSQPPEKQKAVVCKIIDRIVITRKTFSIFFKF